MTLEQLNSLTMWQLIDVMIKNELYIVIFEDDLRKELCDLIKNGDYCSASVCLEELCQLYHKPGVKHLYAYNTDVETDEWCLFVIRDKRDIIKFFDKDYILKNWEL